MSNFLLAASPFFIILPLFIAQYILAIFTLTRLAYARFDTPKYIVWNIIILLVFFVGSIIFLFYYYAKRKSQVAQLEREEEQAKSDKRVEMEQAEKENFLRLKQQKSEGETVEEENTSGDASV